MRPATSNRWMLAAGAMALASSCQRRPPDGVGAGGPTTAGCATRGCPDAEPPAGCAPGDDCDDCTGAPCPAPDPCRTCAFDCGGCPAEACGNGVCDDDESCLTCPADCGGCPVQTCGDGICGFGDHCWSCPEDCGDCSDVVAEVVRGPYLQNGSATAVSVRWRTNIPTDSIVAYGLEPGNLTWTVKDPSPKTEHELRLEGLSPRTVYYYAFGRSGAPLTGDGAEHSFITAIPGGQPGAVRIWAIGDSGQAGDDQARVYEAYREHAGDRRTDVWLMLGDNAYYGGTDEQYQEAVFDAYPQLLRTTMLWPTIGNGDQVDAGGDYFSVFTLPTQGEAGGLPSGTESYYSFDYGNIHFVCLDSDQHDTSKAMATWLVNDLESRSGTWLIAYWHHPPYTKGSHDSDAESQLVAMRERFVPILEDHGVDLVLTGHSHSYERSVLLNGHYGSSTSLSGAHRIDAGNGREDEDGAYDKGDDPAGAVYLVAGSSSKVSFVQPTPHPAMVITLEELGSMVIDVDGPRLDARFLDDRGEVRDSFTMQRRAGP